MIVEDYVMGGNFNQRGKAHFENGICNTISTVEKDTLVCEKTTVENIPCQTERFFGGQFAKSDEYTLDKVGKEVSSAILSRYYKGIEGNHSDAVIVASRGRNPYAPSDRTTGRPTEQRLEPNSEGICNCLTSVQKDNMVLEARQLGYIEHGTGKHQSNTVYDEKGLSPAITTINGGGTQQIKICEETVRYRIRKLTPLECWRLMDFSDEDFRKAEKVNSNTQLYKQAGNSIVCAVLCAIFSQLGIEGVNKWNDRKGE